MKRKACSTCACATLLTLAATGATADAAERISLRLGGYSKWWVTAQTNDAGFLSATNADYNSVDLKGDNEIHFLGSSHLDNGLAVGIKTELEAGGDVSQSTDPVDKAFVWIEGGFGKVELGTDYNAASLLHVAAPEAAGLWNGPPVGLMANNVVVRPSAVGTMYSGNQTELDHDDNAEKILYFTPLVRGIAVALSYTPSALSEDERRPSRASEIMAAGVSYNGTAGPVDIRLSAGHLAGSLASASGAATVRAVSFGAQFTYAGITVGGSMGDDRHDYGNAARAADATDDTGHSWDVGVMVEHGPTSISLDHYRSAVRGLASTPGDDRIGVWQLSGRYSLAPGVAMMGALGHIDYDDESGDANAAAHNDGVSLMTGLGLWF